jgi:hypothetical protein
MAFVTGSKNMKSMLKNLMMSAVAAMLLSVFPQAAMAVLGESDYLDVVPPTGLDQILQVYEQRDPGNPDSIAFNEQDFPNNLWNMGTPGNGALWGQAIALAEPGSKLISDVVGVASLNGIFKDGHPVGPFVLAFMSDDNLDLAKAQIYFGPMTGWSFVTEGDSEIDVTKFLDFSLVDPKTQAFFFSDVEVPEPTTMLAGALLLVPFAASTLRFLRKKAA